MTTVGALPALEVGRTYSARVETLMADGRVRLVVAGVPIDARCRTGLRQGEIVEVEVDRLWPEVVLRVTRRGGLPRLFVSR